MKDMFKGCCNFNQPLNSWNIAKVQSFEHMFAYATDFLQDLTTWELNTQEDGGMFDGTRMTWEYLPFFCDSE